MLNFGQHTEHLRGAFVTDRCLVLFKPQRDQGAFLTLCSANCAFDLSDLIDGHNLFGIKSKKGDRSCLNVQWILLAVRR